MIGSVEELQQLREENGRLRRELADTQARLSSCTASVAGSAAPYAPSASQPDACSSCCPDLQLPQFEQRHDLSKGQVERYSRQLLLPSFGVQAQDKLCKAAVLIVGCGGLGSPAALYLAAMGVGKLGLVDRDGVEASNLHRQIAHTERRVGVHKALSARTACEELNSSVEVQLHTDGFTAANAVGIVGGYDVVLDCSDNPATRYLISDACAATGRPLVSGAAVGTDGQLTVYCGGGDAPCYRCLFPESPAPENCSRCSDAGVLGVVPGVIGTLQALEAVKLVTGVGDPMTRRLLVFDGLAGRFMGVKLRARRDNCVACGLAPSITADNLAGYDYEEFTGQAAGDGPPPPLRLLAPEERISVQELREKLLLGGAASGVASCSDAAEHPPIAAGAAAVGAADAAAAAAAAAASESGSTSQQAGSRQRHVLLDVRPSHQFEIMSLPGAHSFPFSQFDRNIDRIRNLCSASCVGAEGGPCPAGDAVVADGAVAGHTNGGQGHERAEVLVICRRGNDSQRAVVKLKHAGISCARDVTGGYTAWAAEVDASMPVL